MGGGRRLDTGVAVAVGGPNDSSERFAKPIPTNRFRQISRSHCSENEPRHQEAPPPYCTAVSRLDHAAAPVEPRQPTLSNTHPRTRPFDT